MSSKSLISLAERKMQLIVQAIEVVANSYLASYLPTDLDGWSVAKIEYHVLDKVYPHLHRMRSLDQAIEVFYEVTGYWPYMFLTQQQLETLFVVLQKYLRLMISEED